MKLSSILLSVVALAAGVAARAQDEQAAIAAIRKLGGQVTSDPQKPGVAVVLTGSARPTECLRLLKDVGDIHTCDL